MLDPGLITAIMRLRDEMSPALIKAGDNLRKTGANMQRTGASMTRNISLPIAAIGIGAIKSFGDFDSAMVSSLAIMGDVSDEMRGNMSAAAREVATTTTFSATEAAESYFFLASAGLDAAASIEALPQVAKFAQAGSFDMALATDLLTDAQSALGLTIKDDVVVNMANMIKVSDVLVGANTLANASVQQFSEALTNKAGAAMRQLNIDLESGVAVLAVWAEQGVKGSEAGERFNIVTRDLQKAARDNAAEFERFNIAVFDQEGNFRNLSNIVADIEGALEGMSAEQQGATLATLGFTSKSIAATQSLLGFSGAIADNEANLRDLAGITDEVANKQLQSFWAQLGLLKSRLVDVAISLGQELVPIVQDAIPAVESMAEVVGAAVGWFGDLPGPVKAAAVGIAAVAAAAGPVLIAFGSMTAAAGILSGALGLSTGLMFLLAGPVGLIALISIGLVGAYAAASVASAKYKAEVEKMNTSIREQKASASTLFAVFRTEGLDGVRKWGEQLKLTEDEMKQMILGLSQFRAEGELTSTEVIAIRKALEDVQGPLGQTKDNLNEAATALEKIEFPVTNVTLLLGELEKAAVKVVQPFRDLSAVSIDWPSLAPPASVPVLFDTLERSMQRYGVVIPDVNRTMGELIALWESGQVSAKKMQRIVQEQADAFERAGVLTPELAAAMEELGLRTGAASTDFAKFFNELHTGNSTIDGFLSRIKSFLGIFKSIGSALANLGGKFGDFFSGIANMFSGGGGGSFFGDLGPGAFDIGTDIGTNIGDGATEAATGIFSMLPDFVQQAVDFLPIIGPLLAAFGGPLLDGIKAIGKKIFGFLFKSLEDIRGERQAGIFGAFSVPQSVLDSLAALSISFSDAGRSLPDTIASIVGFDDVLKAVGIDTLPQFMVAMNKGDETVQRLRGGLITGAEAADFFGNESLRIMRDAALALGGSATAEFENMIQKAIDAGIAIPEEFRRINDAVGDMVNTSTTLMSRRLDKVTERIKAAGLTAEQEAIRIERATQRIADRIAARNGAAGTIETAYDGMQKAATVSMGKAGNAADKASRKTARVMARAANKAKRELDRISDDSLASTTATAGHFDDLASSITRTFEDMEFEIPVTPVLPKDFDEGQRRRDGGKIPGFALGGIVPGPIGAPQLAVVHGGETVTPPGRAGSSADFAGLRSDIQALAAALRRQQEVGEVTRRDRSLMGM